MMTRIRARKIIREKNNGNRHSILISLILIAYPLSTFRIVTLAALKKIASFSLTHRLLMQFREISIQVLITSAAADAYANEEPFF